MKQKLFSLFLVVIGLIVGTSSMLAKELIVYHNSENYTAASSAAGTYSTYSWSDGFNLQLTGKIDKNYSAGNGDISIGGTSYKTIKNSNGAANTFYAPSGSLITKVVFYVTTNADSGNGVLGSFNGESCSETVKSVKDYANPTVITKTIPNGASEVSFTFGSKQVCFVAVVTYYNPETISEPTIVTDLPATESAVVGTSLSLSVTASNADTYQWYRCSDAEGTGASAIIGATTAAYDYIATTVGTQYMYCVASNLKGNTQSSICAVTASAPAEFIPVTFGLTRPLTAPAEEGGKGTMGASVWNTANGLIALSEIKGSEVITDGGNREYVINNVTYVATQSYRKDASRSAFDEAQYAGYTFTVPEAKKLDLTSVSARLSDASNCTWTWKISVQNIDSTDPATQIWGTSNRSTSGNSTTTASISDAAFINALSGLKSGTYQAKIYFYQSGGSKCNTIDLTFTGNLFDADPEVAEVTIPETANAILNESNTIRSTVNAYPAVTAYQWYSCDANGENATAVEGATSSTLTFTPSAEGTIYYYLAATNEAGTANSNVCAVTVMAEAEFADFSAILNNQSGSLLTSAEQVQNTAVNFGIAVDEDGNTVRVAADSPLAFATVSGSYHSDHGMQHLTVTTKVSGNVKISVGECTYSGNVITVKNAANETVASTTPVTECWKNNNSKVAVLYYEGDATTLTISGMSYCPYIAVEAVETVPDLYAIKYYNGSELVKTTQVYEGTTLGSLPAVPDYDTATKRFRGWYIETDGSGGKATASTIPAGDETYYAVYMDKPTTTAGYYMPNNGLELANVIEYLEETSTTGAKIFLKNGTYTLPRGAARHYTHKHTGTGEILWEGDAYDPITYLKVSNVSFIGQSRDGAVITNIEPNTNEYVFAGQYGNANIYEGIGQSDVIQIDGVVSGLYWQDLTVSTGMADAYGRDIAIQDKGTKNIYKNVCLHGYQDTWTSNKDNGLYYFEGGVVRGRTDYLCGKGDIYFNGVELRQLKGGYAAVPSKPANIGWVFKDCVINGDESDVNGNYTLGRPWGSGTPVAVFIDTKMNITPSAIGWNEMSGGWPARFAEYNSVDANGNAISLSGRKTTFASTHSNNPVLTAEEAAVYSDMDAMYGDWNPTQYTAQAEVSNVVLDGNTLTWEGSSEAYLIEKEGAFVALTTETSYTVDGFGLYTVRAANGRGGFGEASESVTYAAPLILTTSRNMAGYRTFYDAENSYVADDNTIVYVAQLKSETEVVLSRLSGNVVPANAPVILKTTGQKENGTADAYYQITLTPSDETAYYHGVNLLAVTTEGQDLSAGAYRLGWDAEDGVAFRLWNPSSASAGIVYLNVSSSLGAKLSIIFDEEEEDVTAVGAVPESAEATTSDETYNVAGQKVGKAYKGLVIRNGKKYNNK